MKTEQIQDDGLLNVIVSGNLDNDTTRDFRQTMDEAVRAGKHRIAVDLNGVVFLSSAGISELLHFKQQLSDVRGFFGVINPSPHVADVLEKTHLADKLLCDPTELQNQTISGTVTQMSRSRVLSKHGVDLELYDTDDDGGLRCEVIGSPEPLFAGQFSEADCQSIEFGHDSLGLGLGAFGNSFAQSESSFGDFVAVQGAVAVAPTGAYGAPDYLVSVGDYVPTVQVLYGAKLVGDFSRMIRFSATEQFGPIGFGEVVDQCLEVNEIDVAGVVMLAECAGAVGSMLRKSPAMAVAWEGGRFDFPEVRDWMSFTTEQMFRRSLILVAGIVARGELSTQHEPLGPLLRPVGEARDIAGHFHAAAFPYRPLKKRTLELHGSVHSLFDSGTLQGVLHLLNDERPVVGAGETELHGGACWIAPITELTGS